MHTATMTHMIHFDTHRFIKKLKAAGVSEKQAEVFAEVQQEALTDCLDNKAATKSDLIQLEKSTKSDLTKLEKALIQVEKSLELKISVVQNSLGRLTWMVGFLLASASPFIFKALFQFF